MEAEMKSVKNLLAFLALTCTPVSFVHAQDSFSVEINVGGGAINEDYYQSTRQHLNQNNAIEQYSTQFYGAPAAIYYVRPGAQFGRIYHQPVTQHHYPPNVIIYSDHDHSQHQYEHLNRKQFTNPRWSAGNQGYADGNNGRNYQGYTNIESHQGQGQNHHYHHYQRQYQPQHQNQRQLQQQYLLNGSR